jgi:uncharacterized membrane protein YdjX (TVP38/TMEM64 family)
MNKKRWLLIAIVIFIVLFTSHHKGMYTDFTVEGIKNYVLSFGVFAPIAYIVMFTLVPLTLFPDSLLALAGGMVFGLFWGALYTLIGAICGGTLAFYISRSFGRSLVEKLAKHKAQWFEDGVEKKGFLLILTLRLIPLIPFDIISYGAGLSKIKYRDFMAGTFLGIIPGVLIYVNLGDKALNVLSIEFMCAAAMLILLFIASFFARKHFSLANIQRNIMKEDKEELLN